VKDRIFVGKSKETARNTMYDVLWVENIKMDLGQTGWDDMD
jgi:hypothetical protein